MAKQHESGKANFQANDNSVAVGRIEIGGNLQGSITIGNTGFTSEEVSTLLTQISSTFQPKPFDGRCPYKGLDVFEEEDAELFFGREKLVDDLISRVKDSRTVFVTGPSGSGKSSLVRAGLIHALKQGKIKNSERWLYATMKPGRDPIGELGRVASSLVDSTNAEDEIRAKALSDATIFARWCEIALKEGRDKRVVLFIDQFEEVFTQISKEEERLAFLNLLTYAATIENGRVIILFSMRSDFVSNCATYPQLNALLNQQFVQIGAMQPEELVSAIAQPALRVGLHIDPDLIAQIINEMKGEPGALPLMQFALKDLFDSLQEKSGVISLMLNDYLQRGGIHKALERHADDSFSKLSKNEQELARSMFSGLIEIGRGTQDTRRTALFDELVPANTKAVDVEAIVQKLADARLITTDEQAGKHTITISHEKLIDAWPWLKKLVNENREAITLQNEITSAAKEWEENKRDASYLFSGGRLANIWEQVQKHKLALGHLAQEFVKAGRRRQQRSRAALISAVSLVLIAAIVASVVFQNQAQANIEIANIAQAANAESQRQTRIARANELAAQSVIFRGINYELSLLLALEAFQSYDTVQSRSALMESLRANSQKQSIEYKLKSSAEYPISVKFSPDGNFIASGYQNGTVIIWDVLTKKSNTQVTLENSFISRIKFVKNGDILAIYKDIGTIVLWDVQTQKLVDPLAGYEMLDINLAGNILALRDNTEGGVVLWDLTTSEIIDKGSINAYHAYFSPKGNYLLFSTDDGGIALDIKNGNHINLPYGIYLAFNPSETIVAIENNVDKKIVFWDIKAQKAVGEVLDEYTYWVSSTAFSPDGSILASAIDYGTINLWEIEKSQLISPPLRAPFTVQNIVFSPDGQFLATGVQDGTIILWDIKTHQPIGQPLNSLISRFGYEALTFSPDGNILAVTNTSDDSIILWDIDPDSWIQKACEQAGRNLTTDEWIRYFPNEEYRTTCPQWPPKPEFIVTPQPAG